MKKNNLLVVGNWKMNPDTGREARDLFSATKRIAKNLQKIQIVICPPFVFLSELEKLLVDRNNNITLGAQDMFWENSGPHTGEIGPTMLRGERYVILGHSERRTLGETNAMVAKKIVSAIKAGLCPILCVGEKARDEHGDYLLALRRQISESLGKLPKTQLAKLIIAYEPVWAIGQAEAMKPEQIHEMTIFIKKVLVEKFNLKIEIKVPVLYGGSVDHKNAKDIIALGEVQGLLVGRESLNPKKFGSLLKSLE